jgi:hypothetical protein
MSKHHRKKTSEEEAGKNYSQHLQVISEKHAEINQVHAETAETEDITDSHEMDQFMLSEFIEMKEDLAEKQAMHNKTIGTMKAT